MKGYVGNIEAESESNDFFRKVLFTDPKSQLVVMSLNPGEDIGMEVHKVDQFIRVEEGMGEAILDGEIHEIWSGYAVVVPAGMEHNIINKGEGKMKLYTIYSPSNHPPGTVHKTKKDAEIAEKDE